MYSTNLPRMTKLKLKAKLVNKLLKELSDNFNITFNASVDLKVNMKQFSELEIQFQTVKAGFCQTSEVSLKAISLFEPLDIKSKVDSYDYINNKYTIWDFLLKIFFITIKGQTTNEEFDELVKSSNENLETLKMNKVVTKTSKVTEARPGLFDMLSGLGALTGTKGEEGAGINSGLMSLVGDITAGLADKLKGHDPAQLLAQLINGGTDTSGGLNLADLIKDVAGKLEDKVKSGEIDAKELEKEAESFAKTLGGNF